MPARAEATRHGRQVKRTPDDRVGVHQKRKGFVESRLICWRTCSSSIAALLAFLLVASVAGPARADAILYAISGDGASPPSTLYALDASTGVPTAVATLGNGDDGEGIAFRPDDALLYHSTGTTNGLEFFETVHPDTLTVGPNLAPGNTYGPDSATELSAIEWYAPDGVFLAADRDFNLFHVTPDGEFTLVGNSGVQMRGFAVVGTRVFGVDPFGSQLFEIDPSNGAVLATLALSVDGLATSGNGLATHPESGAVFALVKNPASPSGGRLLATLDVTTGQATSIGDTGLKLSGISFRSHAPLYAISGDGATPSSTLFTLSPATAVPTSIVALGNGSDGEGIAFRPDDALLYHSSGSADGLEFFETVDPDSLIIGANLAPSATYGPDPATEISAIAWYAPLDVFLASDLDFNFFHITPSGQFTLIGNSGLLMRGFAVVGSRVYGVSPAVEQLLEVDPSNGAILATLPLSVNGAGTKGNGLAVNPETGVVFAIVKNPLSPGPRLLATLDITTGQATSIGDTGLMLAGISFGRIAVPEIAVPSLGRIELAILIAGLHAVAFLHLRRSRTLR